MGWKGSAGYAVVARGEQGEVSGTKLGHDTHGRLMPDKLVIVRAVDLRC